MPKARVLADIPSPLALAVPHDRKARGGVLHGNVIRDDRVGVARSENSLPLGVGEGAVGDRRSRGFDPNRRAANFLVRHGHASQWALVAKTIVVFWLAKVGLGKMPLPIIKIPLPLFVSLPRSVTLAGTAIGNVSPLAAL
jgi:hypothetical protein